jgi:hypothetical protein
MLPGTFARVAPILLESGWGSPIPASPTGKGALLLNWSYYNLHEALPESVDLWASRWPDANAALALSRQTGVVAVDIDVDDQKDADTVKGAAAEFLGHTDFIRIGRTPRQVRFYRCSPDDPIPDVFRRGLEIKAGSGLITTHGWHAGVQRPYQWPIADPLEALPSELPVITSLMAKVFMKRITGSNALGRACIGGIGDGHGEAAAMLRALSEQGGMVDAMEFLSDCLAGAVEGERHHRTLGAVVAAATRGYTDTEIRSAFSPIAGSMFGCDRKGREEVMTALAWIRARGVFDRHETLKQARARAPWIRAKVASC